MKRVRMQAAFGFTVLLPPPAPRAFRLARLNGAGAGRAANGEKSAVVQRVDRHIVFAREANRVGAGPVVQRVEFDQATLVIDGREGDLGAMLGLIGAQAGDPGDGAVERDG